MICANLTPEWYRFSQENIKKMQINSFISLYLCFASGWHLAQFFVGRFPMAIEHF